MALEVNPNAADAWIVRGTWSAALNRTSPGPYSGTWSWKSTIRLKGARKRGIRLSVGPQSKALICFLVAAPLNSIPRAGPWYGLGTFHLGHCDDSQDMTCESLAAKIVGLFPSGTAGEVSKASKSTRCARTSLRGPQMEVRPVVS